MSLLLGIDIGTSSVKAILFDPDTVGPRMPETVCDLPAGAKRLKQKCDGMMATVVNGQVLLRDNEPTGALPGRLLRKRKL